MLEAEALDRALAHLHQVGFDPAVLRALGARRRELSEVLFQPLDAGGREYLVGDPDAPQVFRTGQTAAGNVATLHALIDQGAITADLWEKEAARPDAAVRKRLQRALDALHSYSPALVDAVGPLCYQDGQFIFHRRPGKPRVITAPLPEKTDQ